MSEEKENKPKKTTYGIDAVFEKIPDKDKKHFKRSDETY